MYMFVLLLAPVCDQEIWPDTEFDSVSGGRISGSKCNPDKDRWSRFKDYGNPLLGADITTVVPQ